MSATISAVDCELRSFERGFSCSVIGSAVSVLILCRYGSDCESDMVDTFTSHSSGSDSRSEVWRLKIRQRRDLFHLVAERLQHQIARRTKHAADVRYLKSVALHLQMTNHCDCGMAQFSAAIGNDLQRHLIVRLRRIDYVSTETGEPFVGYRGPVNRGRQIVGTGNAEIRTGQFGESGFRTTPVRRISHCAQSTTR